MAKTQSMSSLNDKFVGKRVAYKLKTVEVAFVCRDVRRVYGNTHLLIEPVSGTGNMWVGSGFVRAVGSDWPNGTHKDGITDQKLGAISLGGPVQDLHDAPAGPKDGRGKSSNPGSLHQQPQQGSSVSQGDAASETW